MENLKIIRTTHYFLLYTLLFMKHLHTLLIVPIIIALFLLAVQQSCAQVEMPKPSPAGSVSQVIGVTKISVDYSAPAVRGREIWGKVISYNKMWRTGANSPTKVTFSTDVVVEGKAVKAGSYTLITIPTEKNWTVILNNDSKGNGVFSYVEEDDVIRVEVTPKEVEMREYLAYMVVPQSDNEAHLVMQWEKMSIAIKVTTDTKANAVASIDKGVKAYNNVWYDYASATEYYVKNDLDIEKAANWADLSIKLNENHFFPQWAMAQVKAKQGKYKEAISFVKKAQEMGAKNGGGFYAARKASIETSLMEWTKKVK
ncbi:Protein of unknown function (DUF2911) [Bernardetia litoralis DSM 6794]|uniref:DUF2911 domain-containing protein n=2 Tax=Bernardetia litoralis TaxID=999 RepID=I4AKD4_BERLS|nr:Protein of unknown function (DUF2911) [Bernardetia litoralis DSM 6794]